MGDLLHACVSWEAEQHSLRGSSILNSDLARIAEGNKTSTSGMHNNSVKKSLVVKDGCM